MNSEPSYQAVVKHSYDPRGSNQKELLFNATNTITDLENAIRNMYSDCRDFELMMHGEDGKMVSFWNYKLHVGRL